MPLNVRRGMLAAVSTVVLLPLMGCFSGAPSEADVKKAYEPTVRSYIKSLRYPTRTPEQVLQTFKFLGCKEQQGRAGYFCEFTILLDANVGTYTESIRLAKGSNGWEKI